MDGADSLEYLTVIDQLIYIMTDQQQQSANRGILPSETLNALDYLVDRLNAASGHLPTTSFPSQQQTNGGTTSSSAATLPIDNSSTNDTTTKPLPIRALLVGTNEGVGLSRSLGSAHTATQLQNPHDANFSHSGSMSEEVLSSIETVWATIVSAVPPHVMAASAAGTAAAVAAEKEANKGMKGEEKKSDNGEDSIPPHVQPPHPLLSPLGMGDHIRTVTATYDNCTLVHVHMAPLVVTFVTLPEANLGAIRSVALPLLKVLLEPVRRALVRSRGSGANVNTPPAASNNGGTTNQVIGSTGQTLSMEEQALFQQQQLQQQQLQFMQQQQSQMQAMDPAIQQQLYQQQMQQMMLAQQQQQQQFQ